MLQEDPNLPAESELASGAIPEGVLMRWRLYRLLARCPGMETGALLKEMELVFGWRGRIALPEATRSWRDPGVFADIPVPVNFLKGFSDHSAISRSDLFRYLEELAAADVRHQDELVAFFILRDLSSVLEYAEALWNGLIAVTPELVKTQTWPEAIADFQRHARSVSVLCQTRFTDDVLKRLLSPAAEIAKKTIVSTFDDLLLKAEAYRLSPKFIEMIEFCARFRGYAPYNNMLVKVQNPSCSFYATARDWRNRFDRSVKEDARPMLILAPMHPVMLVYDLDQTDGPPLPEKLADFAKTSGEFKQKWLERLENNLERDLIAVERKPLSSTNAGFATSRTRQPGLKMRIALHDQLAAPSAFSVLCHEAAHIYLGHLGADVDGWWPARERLNLQSVEIEAEAVAFIVASHLGLISSSDSYLSGYIGSSGMVPESVSIEWIAKVSGKILERTRSVLPKRKTKPATA